MNQLVLIQWYDAFGQSGWQDKKPDHTSKGMFCQSVGFLLRKDKDCIRVALSIEEIGGVGDTLTIPRKMVHKITYLRKVKDWVEK